MNSPDVDFDPILFGYNDGFKYNKVQIDGKLFLNSEEKLNIYIDHG